jgi:hypothetical protein
MFRAIPFEYDRLGACVLEAALLPSTFTGSPAIARAYTRMMNRDVHPGRARTLA